MLSKNSFLLTFVIFAGLSFGGCSKSPGPDSKQKPEEKIDAKSMLTDPNKTPAEKAEQLARASEQLLTVQGFVYADDVAGLALSLDPNNLRAKFVKAILAPILPHRGIAARLAPLARTDSRLEDGYNQALAEIQTGLPNSTLKNFLLDGHGDIQNESDVQAYIDSIADGFAALRQFAKANKDREITLTVPDAYADLMARRFSDACIVIEISDYNYRFSCPPTLNLLELTLNRADFEGIQQLAAGYEIYLRLHNSYDVSGAIRLALDQINGTTEPSLKKLIDQLTKTAKFGTLRAGNVFNKIKAMGIDAISGMRWVMNQQNNLCPFGEAHARNRMGSLFNLGFCIERGTERDVTAGLNRTESALNGSPLRVPFHDTNGYPYSTIVKPVVLFDQPIADLRSLTPLSFNSCGEVSAVADPSLGGVLPQGDGNAILQMRSQCAP